MKALVADWGFLGDVLMTSPIYRVLSEYYEVDTIGYHESRELFEANPYIGHITTTGPGYFSKVLAERWRLYDIAINVTTSFKTNSLLILASEKRLGYSYKLKGLPLTMKVPLSQRSCTKGNRIDEVCALIEKGLGFPCENRDMIFELKKREKPVRNWVGLHVNPRNTQSQRRWPLFGELAKILRAKGARVFYVGTPGDKGYIKSIDTNAEIALTPTIQSLGSFLTRLGALICVNSFPMHLAACLKVPTLALVGGTPAEVVCRETKDFHYIESDDMNKITLKEVLNVLA